LTRPPALFQSNLVSNITPFRRKGLFSPAHAFRGRLLRKEPFVDQRYAITVKFLVNADSAEDAEEMVETACEKATALFPEMSYEGIEDIEEEEEE